MDYAHIEDGRHTAKVQRGELFNRLEPFSRWMAERNLEYVETEGLKPVVAQLRAGGYFNVAAAVMEESARKEDAS